MLALIKQKLVETPGVFVSSDVMIGPDDSCEISGIVNASDSQSSNAARGFSSLITSLPYRVVDNFVSNQAVKSSGSISPFSKKFRIQQRSLERD